MRYPVYATCLSSGHLVEHVIRTQPPCVGPACSWRSNAEQPCDKGGRWCFVGREDTVQVAAESDCEVLLFDLN